MNVCFFSFQSWDAYFRNNSYSAPPSLAPLPKNHIPASQYYGGSLPAATQMAGGLAGGHIDDKLIDDHLAVQAIIRSYQVTKNVSNLIPIQGKKQKLGITFFFVVEKNRYHLFHDCIT